MNNKGEITLIAVIGGAVGVLGLLSTMFWGGHKLVIEPIKEDVGEVDARVTANEKLVGSAIETLGRMDERVKDIDKRVEWMAQRFGYIEPRQSSTSSVSLQ